MHLLVQSRSARSSVLVPIVVALSPALGVYPAAALAPLSAGLVLLFSFVIWPQSCTESCCEPPHEPDPHTVRRMFEER